MQRLTENDEFTAGWIFFCLSSIRSKLIVKINQIAANTKKINGTSIQNCIVDFSFFSLEMAGCLSLKKKNPSKIIETKKIHK